MTIADKLTLLASSKEALRVKLGLPESLPLSEYYKLAIRKPFEPSDLFVGGKQGAWYDPSDKSTLFQDVAGTVPVTKGGDPVALMRDKSGNGNHATQSVSASRPTYQTDGVLHWLELDGTDDYLRTTFNPKNEQTLLSAVSVPSGSSTNTIFGGRSASTTRSFFALNGQKAYIGVGRKYESGVNEKTLEVNSNVVVGYRYTDNGFIVETLNKALVSGTTLWSGTTQPPANSYIGAMNDVEVANFFFKGRIYGIVVVDGLVELNNVSKVLEYKAGLTP